MLAPLAAPQAAPTLALRGVRRRNFNRPGGRLFQAPVQVTTPVQPILLTVVTRSMSAALLTRDMVQTVATRSMAAMGRTRDMALTIVTRSDSGRINTRG